MKPATPKIRPRVPHELYGPQTRKLIEELNADIGRNDDRRAEAEAELAAVRETALTGSESAIELRSRKDEAETELLNSLLVERRLLESLPAIEDAARKDWEKEKADAERTEQARRVVLLKTAEKLEMTAPQRHRLILEDHARRKEENRMRTAREFAGDPKVITEADRQREEEVRKLLIERF